MTLAIACNAVSGLDTYVKVPEPDAGNDGGPLFDAAPPGDARPDARDAAAVDAGAPEAGARAWARWPMPGPDAGYTLETDRVTDATTRLVWSRSSTAAATYAEAASACAARDMVVPTRIELASLLDFSHASPLWPSAFAETVGSPFWTSSPYRATGGAAGQRWVVDFATGGVVPGTGTHVRCVVEAP